jgi:lysophospholipase L1-like esterase
MEPNTLVKEPVPPGQTNATLQAPAPPSRLRRWGIRLALVIFGVLFVIGSIEAAGRFYIWLKYGVPGKSYGLWQYDPEIGAVHRNNSYNTNTQTNNHGFRGREDVFDPKPPGSHRVICYGGSMCFCYNLADGETWPERLQEELRLRPGHDRDQVLNGGHISWSTGHLYRQALRDLPVLKPDFVVIYSGVNELPSALCLAADGYNLAELEREQKYGVIATNLDQARWLKRNSVIMRYLDYHIRQHVKSTGPSLGPDGTAPPGKDGIQTAVLDNPWVAKNYKYELSRMIELIRQYGGTPIFVIECGLPDDERNQRSVVLHYSADAAEMMRQANVPVCDPRPAILSKPNTKELFYQTGVHVSAKGARLLAHEIHKTIESTLRK